LANRHPANRSPFTTRKIALGSESTAFRYRIGGMTPTIKNAGFCALLLASTLSPVISTAQSLPLDTTTGLQPHGVQIKAVSYQGRKAIQVVPSPEPDAEWAKDHAVTGGGIVVLPGTSFHNGTVEIDVAGKPGVGAPSDARGFVGLAFHVNPDASKYEYVYVRPTNGRADDQLRRNHSTQYSSHPDYEWLRLRTESPGKYESYVDLVPGEWTKLKIEVNDTTMRFYVNGASQPSLLVNDLKMGNAQGALALWIGVGTEAYFANLHIAE
jgi:hypothetical protein